MTDRAGLRERIEEIVLLWGLDDSPLRDDTDRFIDEMTNAVAALATPAPEPGELESAYQIALSQIRHDGETIQRLTAALRVASHSPHDQGGEPVEGFPVCSVCGAIQTAPEPPGLDDVRPGGDR